MMTIFIQRLDNKRQPFHSLIFRAVLTSENIIILDSSGREKMNFLADKLQNINECNASHDVRMSSEEHTM